MKNEEWFFLDGTKVSDYPTALLDHVRKEDRRTGVTILVDAEKIYVRAGRLVDGNHTWLQVFIHKSLVG